MQSAIKKRLVLENGKPPQFVGVWTVGEVLQAAQQLAAWVERLPINAEPEPERELNKD